MKGGWSWRGGGWGFRGFWAGYRLWVFEDEMGSPEKVLIDPLCLGGFDGLENVGLVIR